MAQQTTFAFAAKHYQKPPFDPGAFVEAAIDAITDHYADPTFGALAVASIPNCRP